MIRSAPNLRPGPPLRVGIEAQITPGAEGGIDQFLMALLAGLETSSSLASYRVVGLPGAETFLRQWAGAGMEVVSRPRPPVGLLERTKRALGPIRRPVGRMLRSASSSVRRAMPEYAPGLRESDGFFEQLGLDVVHMPYVTQYEKTSIPTVLTLHDLQHRHFPEFFDATQLSWRERVYPEVIAHARLVVTDSEWCRQDIIRQYGADPAKVATILLAPPIRSYAPPTNLECERTRQALGLPAQFALYPALTYQHKNHIRLLEAVAALRDRHGLNVHVVCPGQQKLHWSAIKKRLAELRLESQVTFPGFVADGTLRALYRMAHLVVFPSLFEGAGLPVLEAMAEGVALACSDIPPVREYAGDAAYFFNPSSVDEIAGAIAALWQDDDRRAEFAERGRRRAAAFVPERMAAEYANVYRSAVAAGDRSESLVMAGAR
jgi:glycosyltransferase involved in cell wall biosynthesis